MYVSRNALQSGLLYSGLEAAAQALDDIITFLLLLYESILLKISLNLHPVTWFRRLTDIDRFTLILAIFTGLLAVATGCKC